MKHQTLDEVLKDYADTPEAHTALWKSFTDNVNATPFLKRHRDFVEAYDFGFGDRPFHWAWKLIIDQLPTPFSFCEVGVFQGQIISLVGILAREKKSDVKIVGVTPLDTSGDKYKTHASMDYVERLRTIHSTFGLNKSPMIMKGLSFDPRIQTLAASEGPYDCVYIDGCHDYEVVVDDLRVYGEMLKSGGFLVVDDAGDYLNLPKGVMPLDWKGLEDVSKATRDVVESSSNYQHQFSVGHLRVFRKL